MYDSTPEALRMKTFSLAAAVRANDPVRRTCRCSKLAYSIIDHQILNYAKPDWLIAVSGRRFQGRIEDPRKTWKLSLDVESFKRWYDYSRARDDMLAATHTDYAPWHIVQADDKKRARLNCISHFLSQIPYQVLPQDKIILGKRNMKGSYEDTAAIAEFGYIPEKY